MERMTAWPVVGLAFGTVLGFAAAFGGFGAFFIVLILGLVGFLVGRVMEGELSITQLFGKRS